MSDITSSVTSLLGSYSSSVHTLSPAHFQSEETICLCLEILMILISQNELSLVLDPALLDVLFKLIYDSSSPLRYPQSPLTSSLSAMQCVNELLMKRLIPYSCRDTYGRLVASLATLLAVTPLLPSHQSLTPSLPLVDPLYLKRLNLLLYQLVAHYLPAIASSPRFPCIDFLRALSPRVSSLTHSVDYTCAQTDPRGYLQLLIVWNETLDFLTGANWGISRGNLPSRRGGGDGSPAVIGVRHAGVTFTERRFGRRIGGGDGGVSGRFGGYRGNRADFCRGAGGRGDGGCGGHSRGGGRTADRVRSRAFPIDGRCGENRGDSERGSVGIPALLSLAREALEGALQLLESGRENELSRDESTMLRLMRFLDFGDASVSLLGLLARVIQ